LHLVSRTRERKGSNAVRLDGEVHQGLYSAEMVADLGQLGVGGLQERVSGVGSSDDCC
jgi:hypothetical protein